MKIKVPVLPGETVNANIEGKLMEFVVTEYIYVPNKMCIAIGDENYHAEDLFGESAPKELEIHSPLQEEITWHYNGNKVKATTEMDSYSCLARFHHQNKQASAIIPTVSYVIGASLANNVFSTVNCSDLPADFPDMRSISKGDEFSYTLVNNRFTVTVRGVQQKDSTAERPGYIEAALQCHETGEEFLVYKVLLDDLHEMNLF